MLELWYAHMLTTCFLLTKSGKGAAYHERGWPTYESLVSRILKLRASGEVWDPIIDVGDPRNPSLPRSGTPTPA